MTNEEVIKNLNKIDDVLDETYYGEKARAISHNSINMAIESLQENTKLKSEINRLIGKSGMYRDMADSFCESNKKLKAEIEELNKRLDIKETLLKLQETTMSMLSSDKDTFIHLYQDAKAENEQLKENFQTLLRQCSNMERMNKKYYDMLKKGGLL